MVDMPDLHKCIAEIVKASEENKRATYDLVAQNVTARWTFGMFVLALIGTLLTGLGLYYLQANLREVQKQIAVTNPPKLRVLHFIVYRQGYAGDVPPKLTHGEKVGGYVWLVNDGIETATIINAHCALVWHEGENPPMVSIINTTSKDKHVKPLRYIDGKGKVDDTFVEDTKFVAGFSGRWDLLSAVPQNYTNTMNLFIMGYVYYSDRLSGKRYMPFARKYDINEHCFIKVDDCDYERDH
jgi:hypothetical protein